MEQSLLGKLHQCCILAPRQKCAGRATTHGCVARGKCSRDPRAEGGRSVWAASGRWEEGGRKVDL